MIANIRIDLANGLHIRPLNVKDATQEYADALNDTGRVRYMTSVGSQNTCESVARYIQENVANSDVILFGVFEGDCLLGTSRLHDIDKECGTAWMGIFIFKDDSAKKGLGTAVIKGISSFALDVLGLREVRAGIFEDNPASERAFEKAGFYVLESKTHEGRSYRIWIRKKAD
ncbi:MAG TPA: hypothetical protein DEA55_03190 [Rhodospirillaceae bacterium]|nr:hypothetical protein [Rhodospirillaceae bacterium]